MYRFALRPRWLLSHAFAIGLVVLFVNLGFWQLRRHDDKVERNQQVAERTEEPAVAVGTLVEPVPADLDELRYRPVVAEGEYVSGADVLVDNRSNEGLPGAWVVTPLRLDDGSIVAVSRGFQGFADGEVDPAPPPTGRVRVEGTALPFEDRSCGLRTDGDEVVGAACLRQELVADAGGTVLPVAVQRVASTPADADVLVPVPLPELDDGPHRSYAVQWFIFATIGAVGYPLVLRRVARDKAREAAAAADLDAGLAELLDDGREPTEPSV